MRMVSGGRVASFGKTSDVIVHFLSLTPCQSLNAVGDEIEERQMFSAEVVGDLGDMDFAP